MKIFILKIIIIGRRGVVQSAFTTKSLRELFNLENTEIYVLKEEFDESLSEASIEEIKDKILNYLINYI